MRSFRSCIACRKLERAATALTLIALSACGGEGGSDPGGIMSTSNASPGGIWTGTESVSGLQITGIVDEAGDFSFIRSDNTQYVGTAVTSGNSVSATFGGYMPFGSTYTDGSTHGTGTLSGTVQQRVSLSVTDQFRTDDGGSSSGTLPLTFSTLYNAGSSLETISGNYTDQDTGDVISVTSAGDLTWQDARTGCVGNGTISIVNAAYNAYKVQFTYGNCMGQASALNGVPFSGLAYLDTTFSPARATIGVTGDAGGVNYGLVFDLNSLT